MGLVMEKIVQWINSANNQKYKLAVYLLLLLIAYALQDMKYPFLALIYNTNVAGLRLVPNMSVIVSGIAIRMIIVIVAINMYKVAERSILQLSRGMEPDIEWSGGLRIISIILALQNLIIMVRDILKIIS